MGADAAGKKISLEGKLPLFAPHVERFRAKQLLFDREVEFRMLPPGAPDDLRAVFLLELEDLLNLDDPAFATVLDHGVTRDRPFYMIPARAIGTLWKVRKTDAFDLPARCLAARSLAEAYAAAHARDIYLGPPSPLTTCWDPAARRAVFAHHRYPKKIRPLPFGEHVPTALKRTADWDTRSDVFHWAYFAYWLISGGSLPFQSAGPAVPIRCAVPELARDLSHMIDACLARDPAARPAHGGEVAAFLAERDQDINEEISLELSGTIPQAAIAGGLQALRARGALRDPGPAPERVGLALESGEYEIAGLKVDRDLTKSLGVLAALLVVIGGAGGLFLREVKHKVAGYRVANQAPVRAVARPPPPPPPPAVSVLAPSTQARYLGYAGVRKLLAAGEIRPARFPSLSRQLTNLLLKKKLPPSLADRDRILALRRAFRRDRAAACRDLRAYLDDLGKALGVPPGGGARG